MWYNNGRLKNNLSFYKVRKAMEMIEILKTLGPELILKSGIGLEREGLRVTKTGELALSEHPTIFGEKLENFYITTDFSESQVEVITPVFYSTDETCDFLEALTNIVLCEIEEDEFLWPQSMPCTLPDEDTIPIAVYKGEKGRAAREYREKLKEKYGSKKQLVSGIHYNFSYSDEMLEFLWEKSGKKMNYREFSDEIYMKAARNYLKLRWLIIYLTGSSPCIHHTYMDDPIEGMKKWGRNGFKFEDGISTRNGNSTGYKNPIELYPDYSSLNHFIASIEDFIKEGSLSEAKELYSQIRLKPYHNDDILKSLKKDGIKYLEIRSIDLNVFESRGISKSDCDFLNVFMVFLLLKEEEEYPTWQQEAMINEIAVAEHGLDENLKLLEKEEWILKKEWAKDILTKIREMNDYLSLGQETSIELMMERVKDYRKTYAYRIDELTKEDCCEAFLKIAKTNSDQAKKKCYLLKGFEKWEMSTQILIKEAITRGIEVAPLDPFENIIALKRGHQKEYVKQATKTSIDSYITPLLMKNKVVTKKILTEEGFPVPLGEAFLSFAKMKKSIDRYVNKPLVIKPKSTNFGLGISIFANGGNYEDLLEAGQIAFSYDQIVLVEDYLKGMEFRFLIIGDSPVIVLHRRPANVIGDGKRTIQELIEIKNKHPYRGDGKTSPLKKIEIDQQSRLYLKKQNLTQESIPDDGQMIFLRGNSNISTGGDSIDFTDKMPEKFKKIAINSAKAFKAKFCGVDMIIEDYSKEDSSYGIIELNHNPMVVMHAYPYQGKKRRIGYDILKTIKMID